MDRISPRALVALAASALLGCADDGITELEIDRDPSTACLCRLATRFENLALCASPGSAFGPARVYSSRWDASAKKPACEPWQEPQPVPSAPWGHAEVSSACSGAAKLCITLRAGSSSTPNAEDCELHRYCTQIDYRTPNEILSLSVLPAWVAQSSACAQRYQERGGYFEFEVESDQFGCGQAPTVTRVMVCPSDCQTNPSAPGCNVCAQTTVVNF